MAQTKQQKEMMVLVALLLVAAVVWYGFFGRNHAGAASLFKNGPYTPISAEDYGKPLKDLGVTRSTEYKSSGRNIFIAVPPPPPKPEVAVNVEPPFINYGPQPDPPPPPPTLDMKFFGLGTLPANGGPRQAFLQDGEEVRIVGEGDTIRNHIRITHIGNDRIEFEDTKTGLKNSKSLEMPPPA